MCVCLSVCLCVWIKRTQAHSGSVFGNTNKSLTTVTHFGYTLTETELWKLSRDGRREGRREGWREGGICAKDESHQFILHCGIMGILSQRERIAIKRAWRWKCG